MRVKSLVMAAMVLALVGSAFGQVYMAQDFQCAGTQEGGLCWLSDPRLNDTASWVFEGIPQGTKLILRLEGTAEDYCHDCVGRDVLVRIYYGPGDGHWNRMELLLKNRGPGCTPQWYTVTGETEFTWWSEIPSSRLVFRVQRLLECDPHVGFTLQSLTLEAPKAEVVPLPTPEPPPPPPEPSPPPPPPPSPETCLAGMEFSCAPVEIAIECTPPGVNLATISRIELPDTSGPGEGAIRLEPGHYRGSLGPADYHDWYRFRVDFGQGAVVYIKTFGDLVMDVYIAQDPCGTVLAVCQDVQGETALVVPCYETLECEKLPGEGDKVCFLSGACTLFVHMAWRSGSGDYFLSILPAGLSPE